MQLALALYSAMVGGGVWAVISHDPLGVGFSAQPRLEEELDCCNGVATDDKGELAEHPPSWRRVLSPFHGLSDHRIRSGT